MRLGQYPSYRPNNIEWLPVLPDAWQHIRARFVLSVNPSPAKSRELDDSAEVSFVPMEAVGEYGGLSLDRTKLLDEVGSGDTEVEDGDVVVAKITPCFENGKGALANGLVNGVAFGTTELHVLRAGKLLDRRFLFYLTMSHTFRALGESEMYGAGGQKRVPPEFVKDFRVPLPPLSDQQCIVRFLDAQTARIDSLVAKKQDLIEKLKEKRSALIARTVTRGLPTEAAGKVGLNPDPEMMNSGVDWLGEVARHWQVKPLKRVAHIGNGSTPARDNADYWEDGVFPWLNSSVVNLEEVTEAVELVTATALRMCHLPKIQPPAVLVGITGEGRTRGMATTLKLDATINQHIAFIKPMATRAEAGYLRRVMDRAYQFLRSESEGGGSTKGAITCDQIANMKVPVPPLAEQRAIVAYLDGETLRLDALTRKVEAAITHLAEYRQALITSAVTGKIDLREAVT